MRWSRIIGLVVLTLMLVPSFGTALADDTLTVSTVKDSYELGDEVTVKGYTSIDEPVTVVIGNSSGDILTLESDDPNVKGNYTVEFDLDEKFEIGEYEVNATVGELWETTTFEVVIEEDDDEEDDGACEDFETVDDLLCAIERALYYLNKVNDTTEALQIDYDMTSFWEYVEELNQSLTELYDDAISADWETSAEELIERFCDLRKEVSQLNGLLNSITKNVKAKKAQQFTMNMIRHINRLTWRIGNLTASEKSEQFANTIRAHNRTLNRLWLTLNTTIGEEELEELLGELQGVSQGVESGLDGLGEEGLSLKQMYKLQAKIDVFRSTVERMEKKGKDMGRLQEKLGKAEELMNGIEKDWNGKNWGKVKDGITDSNENLGGVGKTIRELNKPDKPDKSNKGGNGKGKNKGN
jgi:hypothetical protein